MSVTEDQQHHLCLTGFDSAWGGTQRGAICDFWFDTETGETEIREPPSSVTWDQASQRVDRYSIYSHHVLAIDQGLIVPNARGMRPVEKLLAKALGSMHCSAYPSSRSNESCYGPRAGIWSFLSRLDRSGYRHEPMRIPGSSSGRFYFECYPHPAIIGLLDRRKILKYKCRHSDKAAWDELVGYLKRLPVRNLPGIVGSLSFQNKSNEDKLDSIVCAYTALLWWQRGTDRSTMIGDMSTGYIVTPHNEETLTRFKKAFVQQVNRCDAQPAPVREPTVDELEASRRTAESTNDANPVAPPSDSVNGGNDWLGPVELVATDTTNLPRNLRPKPGKRSRTINDWMDMSRFHGHRLIVKLLDEDGEPEIAFVPHSHSDDHKCLMPDREGQPGVWLLLVAGASKKTPLRFRIKYKYQMLP